MNFRELFEQGRKQEIQYREKKLRKQMIKKPGKPSAFSLAGVIIGAGVLYQIVSPIASPIIEAISKIVKGTLWSIKGDIMAIARRLRKSNEDWEKYEHFLELGRERK